MAQRNMIRWIYFPKSDEPIELIGKIARVFELHSDDIDSKTHSKQESNAVLEKLAKDLVSLRFKVETGKKREQKIRIPVLYGMEGKPEKAFDADAYHEEEGFVLEIEAGRGFTNYQFLKDLFEACMMHGICYLAIAVRNTYRGHPDFDKVKTFFETLYSSSRLKLPLKGVMIIGY